MVARLALIVRAAFGCCAARAPRRATSVMRGGARVCGRLCVKFLEWVLRWCDDAFSFSHGCDTYASASERQKGAGPWAGGAAITAVAPPSPPNRRHRPRTPCASFTCKFAWQMRVPLEAAHAVRFSLPPDHAPRQHAAATRRARAARWWRLFWRAFFFAARTCLRRSPNAPCDW